MKLINRTIKYLLGIKRRQIAYERARSKALEETHSILSTYVALLVEEKGCFRVSASLIGKSIGKYRANVLRDGEDYIISIERESDDELDFGICEEKTDVSD